MKAVATTVDKNSSNPSVNGTARKRTARYLMSLGSATKGGAAWESFQRNVRIAEARTMRPTIVRIDEPIRYSLQATRSLTAACSRRPPAGATDAERWAS